MEFIILVLAAALASLAHWLVIRDSRHAIAVGVALFVFALVPFLVGLYGGR